MLVVTTLTHVFVCKTCSAMLSLCHDLEKHHTEYTVTEIFGNVAVISATEPQTQCAFGETY